VHALCPFMKTAQCIQEPPVASKRHAAPRQRIPLVLSTASRHRAAQRRRSLSKALRGPKALSRSALGLRAPLLNRSPPSAPAAHSSDVMEGCLRRWGTRGSPPYCWAVALVVLLCFAQDALRMHGDSVHPAVQRAEAVALPETWPSAGAALPQQGWDSLWGAPEDGNPLNAHGALQVHTQSVYTADHNRHTWSAQSWYSAACTAALHLWLVLLHRGMPLAHACAVHTDVPATFWQQGQNARVCEMLLQRQVLRHVSWVTVLAACIAATLCAAACCGTCCRTCCACTARRSWWVPVPCPSVNLRR